MDYQLRGQTAFVSAGAHGIGQAIADLLSQEGAAVVVADQDETALRSQSGKWKGTVAANLATAEELASLKLELQAFAARPDTTLALPRIFQAWGRKP